MLLWLYIVDASWRKTVATEGYVDYIYQFGTKADPRCKFVLVERFLPVALYGLVSDVTSTAAEAFAQFSRREVSFSKSPFPSDGCWRLKVGVGFAGRQDIRDVIERMRP
jgi:hypothetical protein